MIDPTPTSNATSVFIQALPAIIGSIAPIITAVIGYFFKKSRDNKKLRIREQQQMIDKQQALQEETQRIWDEQEKFRNDMLKQMDVLRETLLIEQKRNINLEAKVNEWEKKYKDLDTEWKTKYNALEQECKELREKNTSLQTRVNELEDQLEIFKRKNN